MRGYRRGDLKVANCPHKERSARASLGDVYLPHECGEWGIGDKESVRALIADLEEHLAGTYVDTSTCHICEHSCRERRE